MNWRFVISVLLCWNTYRNNVFGSQQQQQQQQQQRNDHNEQSQQQSQQQSSTKQQPKFPYLYAARDNFTKAYPVIEYIAPEHRQNDLIQQQPEAQQHQQNRPDFLYSTNDSSYRIVEFYVHWCDVCKRFVPDYINVAKRIQEMIVNNNNNNRNSHHQYNVSFYAISCTPNRIICKDHTNGRFPTIRLLQPNSIIGIDMQHTDIHPIKILDKFGIYLNHMEDTFLEDDTSQESHANTEEESSSSFNSGKRNKISLDKAHTNNMVHDMILSFDFAMRYSVYTTTLQEDEELPLDKQRVLKEWLKLLKVTFPSSMIHLRATIQDIFDNFEYVVQSEEYMFSLLDNGMIEYVKYKFNITDNADSSTSTDKIYQAIDEMQWSTECSNTGDPNVGYTCGLWEIFHTVTVGTVDYNRYAQAHQRVSTEYVAQTIRNYIDHFFGCTECRTNFLQSYDNCMYNRCTRLSNITTDTLQSWIELPIWLHETHNGVTVRLLHERSIRNNFTISEDEIQNVLWPSKHDCEQCWVGMNINNNDSIYKYLKLYYGQKDDVSTEYRKQLFSSKISKVYSEDTVVLIDGALAQSVSTTVVQLLPSTSDRDAVEDVKSPTIQNTDSNIVTTSEELMLQKSSSQQILLHQRHVIENNAHMSLRCALVHHLFPINIAVLTSKRKQLLKKFLKLIRKTIPITWNVEFEDLVNVLLQNIHHWSKDKAMLMNILDEYDSEKQSQKSIYSVSTSATAATVTATLFDVETIVTGQNDTCSIGTSTYLNGIWSLLHTITIGIVQYNTNAPAVYQLSTKDVANDIVQIVSYLLLPSNSRFINCIDCSKNFKQALYDDCTRTVPRCTKLVTTVGIEIDWIQLSLWLYDSHNYITKLIPTHNTVANNKIWPSKRICPICYINNKSNNDPNSSLDDNSIYQYLRILYGQQDEDNIKFQKKLFDSIQHTYEDNDENMSSEQTTSNHGDTFTITSSSPVRDNEEL